MIVSQRVYACMYPYRVFPGRRRSSPHQVAAVTVKVRDERSKCG